MNKKRPRITKMSRLQHNNQVQICVFHTQKEKKPQEKKEFFQKKDHIWLDVAWMFRSYGKVSVL
ncbi:MAG: hypothetical protein WCH65_00445 [bacterium]